MPFSFPSQSKNQKFRPIRKKPNRNLTKITNIKIMNKPYAEMAEQWARQDAAYDNYEYRTDFRPYKHKNTEEYEVFLFNESELTTNESNGQWESGLWFPEEEQSNNTTIINTVPREVDEQLINKTIDEQFARTMPQDEEDEDIDLLPSIIEADAPIEGELESDMNIAQNTPLPLDDDEDDDLITEFDVKSESDLSDLVDVYESTHQSNDENESDSEEEEEDDDLPIYLVHQSNDKSELDSSEEEDDDLPKCSGCANNILNQEGHTGVNGCLEDTLSSESEEEDIDLAPLPKSSRKRSREEAELPIDRPEPPKKARIDIAALTELVNSDEWNNQCNEFDNQIKKQSRKRSRKEAELPIDRPEPPKKPRKSEQVIINQVDPKMVDIAELTDLVNSDDWVNQCDDFDRQLQEERNQEEFNNTIEKYQLYQPVNKGTCTFYKSRINHCPKHSPERKQINFAYHNHNLETLTIKCRSTKCNFKQIIWYKK